MHDTDILICDVVGLFRRVKDHVSNQKLGSLLGQKETPRTDSSESVGFVTLPDGRDASVSSSEVVESRSLNFSETRRSLKMRASSANASHCGSISEFGEPEDITPQNEVF